MLYTEPGKVDTDELVMQAWTVIANAGMNGSAKSLGWNDAAIAWRDEFHNWLDGQAQKELDSIPEFTLDEIEKAQESLRSLKNHED